MTFEVGEVLGSAIAAVAKDQGVTPQELVFQVLKERFVAHVPREPLDDFERHLFESAGNYGGGVPLSAFTSDQLYDD